MCVDDTWWVGSIVDAKNVDNHMVSATSANAPISDIGFCIIDALVSHDDVLNFISMEARHQNS